MIRDLKVKVVVIGAGPAGCSASLFLSKQGISHVIFDKAAFPRDKICGDGLSGKVVAVLKQLDGKLLQGMYDQKSLFLDSWGVRFVAPNGNGIDLPFKLDMKQKANPPGFVSKRRDFDHFFVKQLDTNFTDIRFKTDVTAVDQADHAMRLTCKKDDKSYTCYADVIISAEGDRSKVAKKLAGHRMNPAHYFAGLRAYYKNVEGRHPDNFIELHFLKEVLPGYFWIFPLPDNQFNVGIGMLSRDVRKKKANLKSIMRRAIAENPTIRERFKNAELIDDIKGWGIPLGSVKRRLSGDRYLLTGDAASLVDPFTGEGIGNALLSGQFAAEAAGRAIAQNNFSAGFFSEHYDQKLYAEIWDEIRLSHTIQRLVQLPWLFNFVINRIQKNSALRKTFSAMFDDLDMRARLRSPRFYWNLLTSR